MKAFPQVFRKAVPKSQDLFGRIFLLFLQERKKSFRELYSRQVSNFVESFMPALSKIKKSKELLTRKLGHGGLLEIKRFSVARWPPETRLTHPR